MRKGYKILTYYSPIGGVDVKMEILKEVGKDYYLARPEGTDCKGVEIRKEYLK